MDRQNWLAVQFEERRPHLRAVAYRILGSASEADDAVQETWLRASRADSAAVANLGGWLTTIVARVCLNLLEARRARREESLDAAPALPIVVRADWADPEGTILLGEEIGSALLVVLDILPPAERVALVLHDAFAVPFDLIAPIVGRTPAATRQLASRARRRVREEHLPPADHACQRQVVEAFLAAAREGDFAALLAVLDPNVILRIESAGAPIAISGARAVAEGARAGALVAGETSAVLVDNQVGIIAWEADGRPRAVLRFAVVCEAIAAITAYTDPAVLAHLGVRDFAD